MKLPLSCRKISKKPFNSIIHFRVNGSKKYFGKKVLGGAGYRSRYLSHAKRALYHLSYAPSDNEFYCFLILYRLICSLSDYFEGHIATALNSIHH